MDLYHHGIKGQRWGVRRYQNEDGTLTEAGKKRYNYGSVSVERSNKDPNTYIISKGDQSVSTSAQALRKAEYQVDDIVRDALISEYGVSIKDIEKVLTKDAGVRKEINRLIDESMEISLSKYIDKYGKQSSTAKSKPKYTQEQAINKCYDDLEKKHPKFNSYPQSKQDKLFMDYANESGLYKYMIPE